MIRASDISVFEIFKVGIGPSSSHTMGPMAAAGRLRAMLGERAGRGPWRLTVELYGSLAATGSGHRTADAVCAGLLGLDAARSPVRAIWAARGRIARRGGFEVDGRAVRFHPEADIHQLGNAIDGARIAHPNTLRFIVRDARGRPALVLTARSVGGGFVEFDGPQPDIKAGLAATTRPIPYPFDTMAELIEHCERTGITAAEAALANESARGWSARAARQRLMSLWGVMRRAIDRGLRTEGTLPGGLGVRRRAPELFARCRSGGLPAARLADLRVSAYAMAVNEENAAGGRVVTAPTNGAAGLLPAVLMELLESGACRPEAIPDALLTAGAIGAIIKRGASISGAEVGCQGEVGAACAMAAAAAAAVLGGSVRTIEAAAEIGIEHHLGLTCDPVGGLVQIPCIERNAMGAVQALGAATIALAGGGRHMVSLDRAVRVMKQTGHDMKRKYRETGAGGLGIG